MKIDDQGKMGDQRTGDIQYQPITEQPELMEIDRETANDIKPSTSLLATALGVGCFPLTLLCSLYVLDPKEEAVVLNFGKYNETKKTPGLQFNNCFGREIRKISTKKQSIDLPNNKIVDLNGNPLQVSAVVVYYFRNTKRAALDIENPTNYIYTQAQTVLKAIVSQFAYETQDGSPSLKTESDRVSERLVTLMQEKITVCGAVCVSFQLNEISYAPEIAAAMLRRQQAKALIDARQSIIEGAVTIACSASKEVESRGIKLTAEEKAKMVINLVTVTSSDKDQTTVPVQQHS
eukprot:Lithocolla_globosa_v1_NODE_7252_length_971_cov_177.435590.p1 type:complete len:291 gc:universal NODE_7252_length_971_cov_177.435590:930-58(-)